MKKSKTETAETRQRIVETAARQFRENGIQGTGLSDVMVAAGLTHGGFYRHFASKDQLVAEACSAASETLNKMLEDLVSHSERPSQAIPDFYLSKQHRDNCGEGCPFAAMGSELARQDGSTRTAVTQAFVKFLDLVAKQMRHQTPDNNKSDALFAVSAMIGAITMARIVDNPVLSEEILRNTKRHLAKQDR